MEWPHVIAIAAPAVTTACALLKYVMSIERRLMRIEAKLGIEEES